jgi:REP element-mobilizing transposase RayT
VKYNISEVISMTRHARAASSINTYHIVQRGVNRQQIFEEDGDYKQYVSILSELKKIADYELYGYCLMGNHLHLLIKIKKDPLEIIFKRLGVRYASWFNHKYERSGHLFQDRFLSEAVEDERYLLSVLCYIHQNPVKVGLCKKPEDYPWSSCKAYLGKKEELVNTGYILSLFSKNTTRQLSLYKEFMLEDKKEIILDYRADAGFKDEQLRERIASISGVHNISDIQQLGPDKRDELIRTLKEEGASLRRIARLTGISIGIVRNR